MKFTTSHSYMKHLLIFAAFVCLYSVGSHAIDLNAKLNGVLVVNGSAAIRLNASYPKNEGYGYKDVNVTLNASEPVKATEVDISNGRIVVITYPLTDRNVVQMMLDMRKSGELFYIHQVNFTFNLADLPDLGEDFDGDTLSLTTNVRPKFQTPDGHVFQCKTTIPMEMNNGSKLTFTNTEFWSFSNTTNWDTAAREVCPRDFVSKPDVRIATGSAFAALIVAAIIGAVVFNCKKGDSD